jgi:hypothetical protein
MAKRKHISWKTKCAAATRELDYLRGQMALVRGASYQPIPYDHAKTMTQDQFLSLFQWDHNKLHSFDGGDHFTNLSPLPTKAHREKTKRDAKIIAKSRRITAKQIKYELFPGLAMIERHPFRRLKRKIRSRGFDKTRTRGVDGRVRRRRTRNVSRNYSPP